MTLKPDALRSGLILAASAAAGIVAGVTGSGRRRLLAAADRSRPLGTLRDPPREGSGG